MIRVNLIPRAEQLRRLRRQRLMVWAVCNALLGVALMFPLSLEGLNRAKAAELRVANLQVQEDLSAAQAELRSVRGDAERLDLQLQRADALRSKRAWSGMLGLVAQAMPPGCWLTQVATEPAAPNAAGASVNAGKSSKGSMPGQPEVVTIEAPRKLRLTGYALEADKPLALVTNLKRSGVFSNVAFGQSQREPTGDASRFRFQLVCEW